MVDGGNLCFLAVLSDLRDLAFPSDDDDDEEIERLSDVLYWCGRFF